MCLSAGISQRPRVNFTKFSVYVLTLASAGSSSDDNDVRYVLPVLWITSCLPIMDHMGRG